MPSNQIIVIAQDMIQAIFKDMDPIWLKFMWDDGGTIWAKMIEIVIMLALLKIRH